MCLRSDNLKFSSLIAPFFLHDVKKVFMDVRRVTVIRNAGEELRDHENWKVS